MIRVAIALLALLLSACMMPPKQLESSGLAITNMAILTDKTGAYYFITLDLNDEIPANTYAIVNYQDLENPEQMRTLDLGSMQDARRINFKSKPVKTLYLERDYRFEVILFNKASRAKVVASRAATIQAQVPAEVAKIFDIKLL